MKRTQILRTTMLAVLVAFVAGCMCPAPKTQPAPAAPVVDNEREKRMEEAYGSK